MYGTRYREQGAERAGVRRQLGAVVALAHRATCNGFGDAHGRAHLSAGNWPDAFGAMMAALMDDAGRYGVALPLPATRIMALVAGPASSPAAIANPAPARRPGPGPGRPPAAPIRQRCRRG